MELTNQVTFLDEQNYHPNMHSGKAKSQWKVSMPQGETHFQRGKIDHIKDIKAIMFLEYQLYQEYCWYAS